MDPYLSILYGCRHGIIAFDIPNYYFTTHPDDDDEDDEDEAGDKDEKYKPDTWLSSVSYQKDLKGRQNYDKRSHGVCTLRCIEITIHSDQQFLKEKLQLDGPQSNDKW